MRARDIMSTGVATVRSDETVEKAIQVMLEKRISGLPVVSVDNRLVGVVTEGDFLRRREIGTERRRPRWLTLLMGPGHLATEYTRSQGRKISEVMTEEVVTAGPDAEVSNLVEMMLHNHIKRIPIVENGVPIGIVSRADLLRALEKAMPPRWPEPFRDDAEILADIQAEFAQADCIPRGAIEATVKDGIVELRGSITDERERAAIRVAVENVRGVKGIHDHILWIEPLSGFFSLSPEDAEAARSQGSGTV